MSEKNHEGKRTARERMQEQRDVDRAREKRKRTLLAGGAVIAVLAVAAVIGVLLAGNEGGKEVSVAAPKGATGKDALVIPSGNPAAASALTVYEDFRCPACGQFEKGFRDTVHSLEDGGKLRVEYHLVRIIDGNLGGSGSLNAANAAACAQDQGKFRAYHDVLYENQPDEREDRFSDKAYLLRLADKVPGLRNGSFTSCVNAGAYEGWVKKSDSAFGASGYSSTPTVLLNGRSVYGDPNNPLTPDKLRRLVADADKGKTAPPVSPG